MRTKDGKIIEERTSTFGRRNDDGTCLFHHQLCKTYDDCFQVLKTDMKDKVNRWVIISLISVGIAAISALSTILFAQINSLEQEIESHNVIMREIAIKQAAVIANQSRIIEQINKLK